MSQKNTCVFQERLPEDRTCKQVLALKLLIITTSIANLRGVFDPTESNLIWDGVRKFVPLCISLADELGISGWRQSKHLSKKIKELAKNISRISASKSPRKHAALESIYSDLLDRTGLLIERVQLLLNAAKTEGKSTAALALASQLNQSLPLDGS